MKSKHGITLIMIGVIVITLALLTTVAVLLSENIVSRTKKSEFMSEIRQIETLVKDYKLRNNNNLNFVQVTIDISGLTAEGKAQYRKESVNNFVTLYIIDLEKIDAIDTKFGKNSSLKDRYLVSNTTGKVYYELGYTVGGSTYYTLDED